MEWPLQERYITENFGQPDRGRVALGATAAVGQQDDRQVGPGRLLLQKTCQRPQVSGVDRLVGDERNAGTPIELLREFRQVRTNGRRTARLRQDQRRKMAVATGGGQDEHPFRKRAGLSHVFLSRMAPSCMTLSSIRGARSPA